MKYTLRRQKNFKYFGSGHTYSLFERIFFLGFACLSRTWPLVCLSPPSLSAAALLALIISDLRYLLWVCARTVHACICFTVSSSAAC